jgi:S1-C subfamily serine protease
MRGGGLLAGAVIVLFLAAAFGHRILQPGPPGEPRIVPTPRGMAEDDRSRRRPDPRRFQEEQGWRGPALPPPSARDPVLVIEAPAEKRNSVGTAFSIDPGGVWMTARHVVDGCRQVLLITAPRRGTRVGRVWIDRRSDIAFLQTSGGRSPMQFRGPPLAPGQKGYHFGFPKGQPGDVSSLLMGRRLMRVIGRYRTEEPVIAWAETRRVPDGEGHLGGISGGPAVDAQGRVVGVTVAGSKRRGRVYTTAPEAMREALARAKLSARTAPGQVFPVGDADFDGIGRRLRRSLTVAQVYCRATP